MSEPVNEYWVDGWVGWWGSDVVCFLGGWVGGWMSGWVNGLVGGWSDVVCFVGRMGW